MKTAKTNRVYPGSFFTIVYRCPYCDNDSMLKKAEWRGVDEICCENCNKKIRLKWSIK